MKTTKKRNLLKKKMMKKSRGLTSKKENMFLVVQVMFSKCSIMYVVWFAIANN